MLKKLFAATGLFLSCVSLTYASYIYIGPMATLQTITATNSSYRGINPRLALGYSQNVDASLDIAGELNVDFLSLNISNNQQGNAPNAKISHSIAAAILPSTLINDEVRGFARLGVITSKFEGPSVSTTGAQFGLGFQIAIAQYWDMRGEYDYTAYRSVTGLGNPKMDSYGLGVIRRFDL